MAILPKFAGARIKRREDPALIQGLGQYVDDIPMAGTLHAAFLRSPYAPARITGLHVAAARQHPGVVAVLTGHDILGKVGTIPCMALAKRALLARRQRWPMPSLMPWRRLG